MEETFNTFNVLPYLHGDGAPDLLPIQAQSSILDRAQQTLQLTVKTPNQWGGVEG